MRYPTKDGLRPDIEALEIKLQKFHEGLKNVVLSNGKEVTLTVSTRELDSLIKETRAIDKGVYWITGYPLCERCERNPFQCRCNYDETHYMTYKGQWTKLSEIPQFWDKWRAGEV